MSSTDLLKVTEQPHVLTIAGSDSGGGAGIQADLKTIAAFGCYGSSVITGLTAQNTLGVQAVHEVPSDFVIKQLTSVFDDAPPVAVKLGMLTSSKTISAIASYLSTLPNRPITILDPVMISTSGHTLLPDDAIGAIQNELLPHVDWITPNIPEAQRLVGQSKKLETLDDMLNLAAGLSSAVGVSTILLKGGHLTVQRSELSGIRGNYQTIWEEGNEEEETVEVLSLYRGTTQIKESKDLVVDVLIRDGGKDIILFVGKKLDSSSTHGTGCTLSSAIACGFASTAQATSSTPDVVAITERAIRYTRSAIASAFPFGKGHGPLNHSHLSSIRALPPPTPHNPHPFVSHLIQSNLPLWKEYVQHPYVVQLGLGTLPKESFVHYLKQDYHYLRHYARAHALGAYKSSSFEDIKAFTDIAAHIARESQNHVKYCAEYGISLEDILTSPESAPCAAYARYVIDVGTQGDVLDLYMAVASCLIGYGEVGLWLKRQVEEGKAKSEGNPYKSWMETYAGDDFLQAVNRGIENLERRVAADPPSPARLARLTAIWHDCVRMERDFWEMGLKLL